MMVDTLVDIPGVEVFIDDILVRGKSLSEHNKRLGQLLLQLILHPTLWSSSDDGQSVGCNISKTFLCILQQ